MGRAYALTGSDTIIINDIPLKDFADGDIGTLEVGNDLFAMSTGKNGNTIFAYDEKGNNATLTVRVLMSSNDDKRLNGLVPKSSEFASTVLIIWSNFSSFTDIFSLPFLRYHPFW